MKYFLLLLSLVSFSASAEIQCENHPIYCDIVKLRPSINRSYAMELSNYIYKYSKIFGTDPKHSVAIAMQESKFINQDRPGKILTNKNEKIDGYTDIGVFQLHVDTLDAMEKLGWDIDYNRIRSDIEYQTALHMRWLRRRIRICKMPEIAEKRKVIKGTEWGCYHSYTYEKRKIYIEDVKLYLDKIVELSILTTQNITSSTSSLK